MALARLARSALWSQCSRSIVISRFASSSSDKGAGADSKPEEAPEVGYKKKPGSKGAAAKPTEKGGAAKTTEKGGAVKPTERTVASKPETSSSTPSVVESTAVEVGYTKKTKPSEAGKGSKAASTLQDVNMKTKAKVEPPVSEPVEKPSPSATAVSSDTTKVAENVSSPESVVPVSEDSGALPDVGYQRRVMPLPEDRAGEVEEEVPADGTTPKRVPTKKTFTTIADYDYNLPLPKIINVDDSKKKKDPVSLSEAIQMVKSSAHCKFVETVEAHIQLGVDPKRSDQIVRGAVTLPHGSGKVVKVAVFADGPAAEEALAAGADVVGTDELVEKIFASGGKLDFEKCIAIPSVMPKLGKVARILGPRGMMPNPKMGTVTLKVGEAVKAAKQGRVDFRADKSSIVHAGLGKINFTDEALFENISAFSAAVLSAKPAGFKKSSRYSGFFMKFHLSCTMGIGVPVSIQSVAAASDKYVKTLEAAAQGA